MQIIAHRGFWIDPKEKNSLIAFKRALDGGFGIETDFRDRNQEIVVAHDLAQLSDPLAAELFDLYRRCDSQPLLALNIKADGLQGKMKTLLQSYSIENYFIFDCSIPDLLGYKKNGMNFYSRQSELEKQISLLDDAKGIWMDELTQGWISNSLILAHLTQKKSVCLVSPELHGRPHQAAWSEYRKLSQKFKDTTDHSLSICTDFPDEARRYFSD